MTFTTFKKGCSKWANTHSLNPLYFVSLLDYMEIEPIIQCIHFNRNLMTFDDCLEWICNNGYKVKRCTANDHVFMFHQWSPAYCKRKGYCAYETELLNPAVCLIKGFKLITI